MQSHIATRLARLAHLSRRHLSKPAAAVSLLTPELAAAPAALRCISTSSSRPFWNKDWKPGPYPKTEAERLAAAKKYGLQPEDYEPYPEMEGYGDYPNITPVSYDSRDPNEHYDYPRWRHDFGEPIEIWMDGYDAYRYDIYLFNPKNPNRYPKTLAQVCWFWAKILFVAVGFVYVTRDISHKLPFLPKQYPYSDLWLERGEDPRYMPEMKHYTFEPATDGIE